MGQLFMIDSRRHRTHGRTWEDEGLGGDPDAGRGGNFSSREQTQSRNEAKSRHESESRAKDTKRGGFWKGVAKVGKGLARAAAAYATGGMSETAFKAGKAVKGWMDKRSAQQGTTANTSRSSRNTPSSTRDHDGQGQRVMGANRFQVRRVVKVKPITRTPAPVAIPTSITAPNMSARLVQNREVVDAVYPVQSFYPMSPFYPVARAYPIEPLYQYDARSWDDDAETLEGLSKSLKKIGKKIKQALKPKNLVKVAGIAAAAYGGYKLLSTPGGQAALSKLGSGLSKVGKAVVASAPQLASSYVAYTAAKSAEPEPMTMEEALQSGMLYSPQGLYASQGLYAPQGLYPTAVPGLPEEALPETSSGLPSWALPAGIGLAALLLLSNRK